MWPTLSVNEARSFQSNCAVTVALVAWKFAGIFSVSDLNSVVLAS